MLFRSYTVQVADTANLACFERDTVKAYIIPDSVAIDINKDTITGNILLQWDRTQPGLAYADSVRIMGVKWDGYAVATQYTPRAMTALDLEKYMVDISNDTLEFFYINASRYIAEAGRSYYSHSSDTVGYFRQWIYALSQNSDRKNDNYITYPFNMLSKGLISSQDLGNFVGKYQNGVNVGKNLINSIAKFDVSAQRWDLLRDYYLISLGIWTNSNPVFNLKEGEVYKIVLNGDASDVVLVLYGKLPRRFSYDLLTRSSTTDGINGENFIAFPLSLAHKRKLVDLGNEITDRNSIARFTFFIQQDWATIRSYYLKSLDVWNTQNDHVGYPWLPINVIVDKNSIFTK